MLKASRLYLIAQRLLQLVIGNRKETCSEQCCPKYQGCYIQGAMQWKCVCQWSIPNVLLIIFKVVSLIMFN